MNLSDINNFVKVHFEDKSITLTDVEIQAKEKLIQTFIVFFGLLLTDNINTEFHKGLVTCFIPFLIFSLIYYCSIMKSDKTMNKQFANLTACGISYYFSSAVALYVETYGKYGDRSQHFFGLGLLSYISSFFFISISHLLDALNLYYNSLINIVFPILLTIIIFYSLYI